MEIVILGDLGKEECEDRLRLCLGNAYYSPREACSAVAGVREDGSAAFER